jgi:hypothetical protein
MLLCQPSVIFPLGTTVAAARATCTKGVASAVVANAAVFSTVRRVSIVLGIFFSFFTFVSL